MAQWLIILFEKWGAPYGVWISLSGANKCDHDKNHRRDLTNGLWYDKLYMTSWHHGNSMRTAEVGQSDPNLQQGMGASAAGHRHPGKVWGSIGDPGLVQLGYTAAPKNRMILFWMGIICFFHLFTLPSGLRQKPLLWHESAAVIRTPQWIRRSPAFCSTDELFIRTAHGDEWFVMITVQVSIMMVG